MALSRRRLIVHVANLRYALLWVSIAIAPSALAPSTLLAQTGPHESRSNAAGYAAIHNLNRLKEFASLLRAQNEAASDEGNQLAEELSRVQQELQSAPGPPLDVDNRSTFLLLDELRDRLDSEQNRLSATETEGRAAKQRLAEAHALFGERETTRRRIKEELQFVSSDEQAAAKRFELEVAQARSKIMQETVRLQKQKLTNSETDAQIGQIQSEILRQRITTLGDLAEFSLADLQAIQEQIDREEASLKRELESLHGELAEADRKCQELKTSLQDQGGGPESEPLVTWHLIRHVRQRQIEMANQRAGELVASRFCWDFRHQLFNRTGTSLEDQVRYAQAAGIVDRLNATEQLTGVRIRETREELVQLESRLRSPELADASEWLARQKSELHRLLDAYETSQLNLVKTRRLIEKAIQESEIAIPDDGGKSLIQRASQAVSDFWNFEVTSIDDSPVSVKKIASGLFLLVIGILLARVVSRQIGNRVLPRMGANAGISQALQSISFYALTIIFVFVVLEILNVPLTIFTFMGGAVAIAAGFGSQNILNNFMSGLILLAERPIRIGDLVEVNGLHGTIEQIGARSTRVRTGSNLELIIPNSKFLENDVTNWTLSVTRIRTVVSVGVAYGSPTLRVEELLRQVIESSPRTLANPPATVLFKEFGDSALNFEVHFWIHMRTMMESLKIESEIRHEIGRVLEREGITIAFPQRDVHLETSKPIELNVRHLGRSMRPATRPKRLDTHDLMEPRRGTESATPPDRSRERAA